MPDSRVASGERYGGGIMTDPAGKNVVRMNQYDATRNLSLVSAVNTLNDCRDTAVPFLDVSFKGARTATTLSEMADQPIRDARNDFLSTARQISQKRISASFARSFSPPITSGQRSREAKPPFALIRSP
jgi:hypothetical protein